MSKILIICGLIMMTLGIARIANANEGNQYQKPFYGDYYSKETPCRGIYIYESSGQATLVKCESVDQCAGWKLIEIQSKLPVLCTGNPQSNQYSNQYANPYAGEYVSETDAENSL